jgi:Uncharacterised protein family UPF0547
MIRPAMEEHKQCPDCAEMVRAEARVCRFCGYRFDRGARRDRGGFGGGAFADLLRRPQTQRSLPEILEDWGYELAQAETVSYFGYCKLDRAYGFLLITSVRLAFFAGRGGARMLEWQLEELREIESAGGWNGGRLRLSGPDRTVTLQRFESRGALAGAARLLGAA